MNPPDAHHVLVVDDEPTVANLIEELLSGEGYRTTVFNHSPRALEFFQADPDSIDLVITDQTMPELTGSELSVAMLKIRPDLPIALCTGYSNAIDRDIAQKIGIRAFFYKPLDIPVFLGTVAELLNRTVTDS